MRAILALGLLAGCDIVYGLSGRDGGPGDAVDALDADPCPNDRDCDFVLDPADNCIDVPNSDQDDFDDDDVGDLCDACSAARSTTNDDDLDQAVDAADNCPSVGNVDQSDRDGDTVGDVCDPHLGAPDELTCFFAFSDVAETNRLWSIAAPWSVQGSRLIHFPAADAPFAVSLGPSGMLTTGTAFELRTTVQFSTVGTFQVGIGIGPPNLTAPGVRCLVDGTFATPTLTLLDATDTVLARTALPVLVGVDQMIAFSFERQGPTSALACSVKDGLSASIGITANAPLVDDPTAHLISTTAHTVFLSLAAYRLGP